MVNCFKTGFCVTVLLVCNLIMHAQQKHERAEDSIAVAKVMEIREVKNLMNANKNKKSHISVMIRDAPNTTTRYYHIQVGISDEVRFQPVYNFYVTPNNLAVKYLDTITDSLLSLKEWRAKRKS